MILCYIASLVFSDCDSCVFGVMVGVMVQDNVAVIVSANVVVKGITLEKNLSQARSIFIITD